MKMIKQPLNKKAIAIVTAGILLFIVAFSLFFNKKPTYAVKLGKLYEVSGDKAKLVGDYSEEYHVAVLESGEEVVYKKIHWGNKKTVFIINGEEHETGPNGYLKAEGDLLVLSDNTKRKKKVNQYGELVR
jgi:hypothetical protein